MLTHLFIGL
jgi:exosome complex component RRP41